MLPTENSHKLYRIWSFLVYNFCIRGGVEDIRLEAKTKDTKKKPSSRPRTHLPRTGFLRPRTVMLETKDQGHNGKCSQKKGLCSNFRKLIRKKQAISKKSPRPEIRKFFTNSKRKQFFAQILRRAPRWNNIAHDLGPFSTNQKIVLFSSWGQDIFEDLQSWRPRIWP